MNDLESEDELVKKICLEEQMPILMDLLCWRPFENILVHGSGDGDDDGGCVLDVTRLLVPRAEKYFSTVTGVMVSNTKVDTTQALQKCDHTLVTFLVGNIMDEDEFGQLCWPLQSVKFDKIFCIHGFHHFVEDYEEFFRRIHLQLNKGGQVVATIFYSNLQNIHYNKLSEYPKWKKYMMEITKTVAPWTYGDVQEIFSSSIKSLLVSSLNMKIVDFVSHEATHSFDNVNEFTDFVWVTNLERNNNRVSPELQDELRQEMAEQGAEIFGVNVSSKPFTITYNYLRFIAEK